MGSEGSNRTKCWPKPSGGTDVDPRRPPRFAAVALLVAVHLHGVPYSRRLPTTSGGSHGGRPDTIRGRRCPRNLTRDPGPMRNPAHTRAPRREPKTVLNQRSVLFLPHVDSVRRAGCEAFSRQTICLVAAYLDLPPRAALLRSSGNCFDLSVASLDDFADHIFAGPRSARDPLSKAGGKSSASDCCRNARSAVASGMRHSRVVLVSRARECSRSRSSSSCCRRRR
jgi:hypothetical protein